MTFREGLEMFCFSIMESSFCFANVEFITVKETLFIQELKPSLNVNISSEKLLLF